MKRYYRLSYDVTVDTPQYPSTPGVSVQRVKDPAKGDSCSTYSVTISSHAGTHVDAPRHFFKTGRAIADYSIDELVFTSPLIIDCIKRPGDEIGVSDLEGAINGTGFDILIIRTGFSRYRNDAEKYCRKNPYLSTKAARWLREEHLSIRAVGIDCVSIASAEHRDVGREVHRTLLGRYRGRGGGLLIVEDLSLPRGMKRLDEVMVVPLFIRGIDSSSCTVIGVER